MEGVIDREEFFLYRPNEDIHQLVPCKVKLILDITKAYDITSGRISTLLADVIEHFLVITAC